VNFGEKKKEVWLTLKVRQGQNNVIENFGGQFPTN
jgi:hypothetical protein